MCIGESSFNQPHKQLVSQSICQTSYSIIYVLKSINQLVSPRINQSIYLSNYLSICQLVNQLINQSTITLNHWLSEHFSIHEFDLTL